MPRIIALCAVLLSALVVGPATAGAHPGSLPPHADKPVCSAAHGQDAAHCHAKVVTDAAGRPLATVAYANGYGPADLANAYKLSSPGGSGETVAIVDAYDNPNAETDLNAYRSQFGLGPCTTANGCFSKVNQNGQASPLPATNTGWGQEIDLDIEMVSALCPQCRILLVEANSNSLADLGAAVNRAAAMGATAISNSYGTNGEFNGELSYDAYYNHPNIAVTVSSGDSGYGTSFPAVSNHVIAVGGTSLTRNSSARGWGETAWSGAGSGCSSYFSKPSWQSDAGCSRRTEVDVAAVADPNTGVAVYDSFGSTGGANWYVFGGTSVSSPIIAAVYALAGNASAIDYPARLLYANPSGLFDVVAGSNGNCVRGRKSTAGYFCTAGPGYDGPTGLGTPNGTTSF